MFFNADGTIQTVVPTSRGVGISKATNKIEIDRYSIKSDTSVAVALQDTLQPFNGWNTVMNKKNDWIQYNSVDFGEKLKKVQVNAKSEKGGTLEIRLDKADGPLIAEVKVPKGSNWKTIETKVSNYQTGIHNLVVLLKDENKTEIDWVKFE